MQQNMFSEILADIVAFTQMSQDPVRGALLAGLAVLGTFFLILYLYRLEHSRWLALCILVLSLMVATWIGGWQGFIAAVFVCAATLFVWGTVLRNLYSGSTSAAVRHQLRLAVGRTKETQVIEDGKSAFPENDRRVFGPHMLLIKPYNAVVMEMGSRVSRICGPSTLETWPFEYVKHIVDLRPRQIRLDISDVVDVNREKLRVVLLVDLRLSLRDDVLEGHAELDSVEKSTIRNAAVHLSDWTQTAQSAVEAAVRLAFRDSGDSPFEDLGMRDTYRNREEDVLVHAQNNLSRWGITVESLLIENTEVRDNAMQVKSVLQSGKPSEMDPRYQSVVDQTREFLTCYPLVEHKKQVEPNERFEFAVRIPEETTMLTARNQSYSEPIALLPSPTRQASEVEVVLRTWGLETEGPSTKMIQIGAVDAMDTASFVLSPTSIGNGQIRTDFYQNGRRIGTTRSSVSAVIKPKDDQGENVISSALPLELDLNDPTSVADLEWCVEMFQHDGNYTLRYTLHSPATSNWDLGYHHKKIGEVTLLGSPLDKMQQVYETLSKLARSHQGITDEDRLESERQLTALGKSLWRDLIPEDLKREYWRFKNRIKSLLITSDEPWIPWEILLPYRHNAENDQHFLCQAFDLSRWLAGPGTVNELAAGDVWGIAPRDSMLPNVFEEVNFVRSMNVLHSAIEPKDTLTSHLEVLDCLEHKNPSIMHFACHGTFDSTNPNNSAIILTRGKLTPQDIHTRFGGHRARPLVFINACHGGRTELSFTGLGGWAAQLISDAQVGAFVGAMWEIDDDLALQFAKTFYTLLLGNGLTAAQAIRQARETIRTLEPWNSSWLAYTLYAYPSSTVRKDVANTSFVSNVPSIVAPDYREQ